MPAAETAGERAKFLAHRLAIAGLAAAVFAYALAADSMLVATGVYQSWDPEFFYMLNSLLPFKGHLYTFIDHPGTPVEMIGTALLALLWPLAAARSETLAELCIRQPWLFLVLAHMTLTAAGIAVAVLLARKAVPLARWDDIVLSLAVACTFYGLHRHALETLVYWSHNSFNFPGGGLLTLVLYSRLRNDARPGRRWLAGMGIASGFLAAVQLYMGAWTIGIAVSVAAAAVLHGDGWGRALRSALTVCAAAVTGFVFFTLPIAPLYPMFLRWVLGLARHQGVYASGAAGFSLSTLAANAVAVIGVHPEVFALLGLATLAIAAAALRDRGALRARRGTFAAGFGIAVQAVVLALAIFKHPGPLYVLSLAALAPVQLAIALACWRDHGRAARALSLVVGGAILLKFSAVYPYALARKLYAPAEARRSLDRVAEILRPAEAGVRTPLRIWTLGTESSCFALWLANNDRVRAFSTEIGRRCPRDGAAWFGFLGYPEAWRLLDPRSVAPILVAAQGALDAQPMLRWGLPQPTGVDTLFLGPYVIIPVGLDRVLEAGVHAPMVVAPGP